MIGGNLVYFFEAILVLWLHFGEESLFFRDNAKISTDLVTACLGFASR